MFYKRIGVSYGCELQTCTHQKVLHNFVMLILHPLTSNSKLEEMTTELSSLRRVVEAQGRTSEQSFPSSHSDHTSRSSSIANSNLKDDNITSSPATFFGIDDGTTRAWEIGDQVLGPTRFRSNDIIQLFE